MEVERDAIQARFYLRLPLVLVPIITFICWAFSGSKADVDEPVEPVGIISTMPDPSLEGLQHQDKLTTYQQYRTERLDEGDLVLGDSSAAGVSEFYRQDFLSVLGDKPSDFAAGSAGDLGPQQQLYERLAGLQRQLLRSSSPDQMPASFNETPDIAASAGHLSKGTEQLKHFEELMSAVEQQDQDDRETEQLNGLLERILDIQHPQRVTQRMNQQQSVYHQASFSVETTKDDQADFAIQSSRQLQKVGNHDDAAGFYGLLEEGYAGERSFTGIEAVVHGDQALVDGSVIKLRLERDIQVAGKTIPRNSFLFGQVNLLGERLHVQIRQIRKNDMLLPVALNVIDMDGIQGIHIPGVVTHASAQESAQQSVQMLRLSSLDASLAGQAASAGVEAAKDLMSRKLRLKKVHVKSGYRVLLQDQTAMQFTGEKVRLWNDTTGFKGEIEQGGNYENY